MADRHIGIKVSEDFFRRVKIRMAEQGLTLREYVMALIQADLDKTDTTQ